MNLLTLISECRALRPDEYFSLIQTPDGWIACFKAYCNRNDWLTKRASGDTEMAAVTKLHSKLNQ